MRRNMLMSVYTKMGKALLSAGLLVLVFSACGKKQDEKSAPAESEEQTIQRGVEDDKDRIIRMESIKNSGSESYNGHLYEYSIEVVPDDSLDLVVNGDGIRAVDNCANLTIMRDGVQMYSKHFTRRAFKIGISDEEFSHYVLSSMIFNKMTTSGPQFIVTLGDADSEDVFVQYSLTVGMDGSINIVRTGLFDEDEIDRFEGEELP